MNEIIFLIEDTPEGGFTAKALDAAIFTEADDINDLHLKVRDAVDCHFEPSSKPKFIRMRKLSPSPIPESLCALYTVQATLNTAYPDWSFSLDGKLIGDIGEVIAEKIFDLEKLKEGERTHDFQTRDKPPLLVQVKATQKAKASKPVGLGLDKRAFDHLIVIEFDSEGYFEVLFNGPGVYVDEKRQGKKSASLSRKQLRETQLNVPEDKKLKAK